MITNPPFRWRQQLFTGNGTFVVPDGVELIFVDGCGGGGGGAGGHTSGTTGGGGGGGAGSTCFMKFPLPVVPGSTLTITVGAGGTGGAAGAVGGSMTASQVTGAADGACLIMPFAAVSGAGTATTGGATHTIGGQAASGTTTAGAATLQYFITGNNPYVQRYVGENQFVHQSGASGGGPGYAGGAGFWGPLFNDPNALAVNYMPPGNPSGSAGSGLGGGGAGGSTFWGLGGVGGNASVAGGNATGYGAGGGGGGCNAAGGNGSPGFIRLFWVGP